MPRLANAVIDVSADGRLHRSPEALREKRCAGRVGDEVIFYQLVAAREWHYYWLCSSTKAKRAATEEGARGLNAWLASSRRRAKREARECDDGSTARMFKIQHSSGILLRAYCDGIISLTYPDRSKSTIAFTKEDAPSVSPVPGMGQKPINVGCPPCRACPQGATCPAPPPCPTGNARRCPPPTQCPRCPEQQACPEARCPTPPPCPSCPKAKPCAAPNTPAACKAFGEKAYWLGVKQACQRICTGIYRRCRKVDPKTSLCYQLSEFCAGMKGVCDRVR